MLGGSQKMISLEVCHQPRAGKNWCFIDTKGNWGIPPRYWQVQTFSEGLTAVTNQPKGNNFPAAYIDMSGRSVIDFPEGVFEAGPFSEGLAAVRLNGHIPGSRQASVQKIRPVKRIPLFRNEASVTNQAAQLLFGGPVMRAGRGNHVLFNHDATYVVATEAQT